MLLEVIVKNKRKVTINIDSNLKKYMLFDKKEISKKGM